MQTPIIAISRILHQPSHTQTPLIAISRTPHQRSNKQTPFIATSRIPYQPSHTETPLIAISRIPHQPSHMQTPLIATSRIPHQPSHTKTSLIAISRISHQPRHTKTFYCYFQDSTSTQPHENISYYHFQDITLTQPHSCYWYDNHLQCVLWNVQHTARGDGIKMNLLYSSNGKYIQVIFKWSICPFRNKAQQKNYTLLIANCKWFHNMKFPLFGLFFCIFLLQSKFSLNAISLIGCDKNNNTCICWSTLYVY